MVDEPNVCYSQLINKLKTPSLVDKDSLLKVLEFCTSVSQIEDQDLEILLQALNIQNQTENLEGTAYDYFLCLCKQLNYPESTQLERHHIVPRHEGGLNDKENLIPLSIPHHAIAHWLRWKLFNKSADYLAFIFKRSVNPEIQRLKAQMQQEKNKESGKLFFNSEFQSKQGKKGGAKGGSANTQKQFEARSRVGKKYGSAVGMLNQSEALQDFLQKYTIWEFTGFLGEDKLFSGENCRKKYRGERIQLYVLVGPRPTLKSILEELKTYVPLRSSPDYDPYTKLYELVPGASTKDLKSKVLGWKIYNTLTRSEVDAGALNALPIEYLTSENLPENSKNDINFD